LFGFYRPSDCSLAFVPAFVFCGAYVEGIETFEYLASFFVLL
jgi:hypothetical protein